MDSRTVHACEATETPTGCMLSWTICGKDVYDDSTYVSRDLDEVSCSVCEKARWEPRASNDPDPVWVPDYKPRD
jgi:hypothetical protein